MSLGNAFVCLDGNFLFASHYAIYSGPHNSPLSHTLLLTSCSCQAFPQALLQETLSPKIPPLPNVIDLTSAQVPKTAASGTRAGLEVPKTAVLGTSGVLAPQQKNKTRRVKTLLFLRSVSLTVGFHTSLMKRLSRLLQGHTEGSLEVVSLQPPVAQSIE